MAKGTVKALHEQAEDALAAGIAERGALEGALRLWASLDERIAGLRSMESRLADDKKRLAEMCSEFAVEHPAEAFDDGLREVRSRQERGSVTLADGGRFSFTRSATGIVRAEGGNFSQEFLESLPKAWTNRKLELSKSGLKDADDAEMASHGLLRTVECSWRKELAR